MKIRTMSWQELRDPFAGETIDFAFVIAPEPAAGPGPAGTSLAAKAMKASKDRLLGGLRVWTRSSACLAVALLFSGSAAAQDVRFKVVELPIPANFYFQQALAVEGLTVTGYSWTRLGSGFNTTNYIQAALWYGGSLRLLARSGADTGHRAWGNCVNRQGVVGGWYQTPTSQELPAVWVDGNLRMPGLLPGGNYGQVFGLSNESDWIAVGMTLYAPDPEFPEWRLQRATVWDTNLGTPLSLGTLPGDQRSVAWAVNRHRQVVGTSWDVHRNAFIWSAASGMTQLVAPAGYRTPEPRSINDHGHVVGSLYLAGFFWSEDSGMVPIPGAHNAKGINNSGVIVGTTTSLKPGVAFSHAGPMLELASLLTPDSTGWTLGTAEDISDLWVIVGRGTNPQGADRAYMAIAMPDLPGPNELPEESSSFPVAGEMGGWTASGTGSAMTRTDPADPDNVVMELVTGSPITVTHPIHTPPGRFAILFDYRFLTTNGTLSVYIDETELALLPAPPSPVASFQPASMIVDDPALFDLDAASLKLELAGPTGARVLIDNIELVQALPRPRISRIERPDDGAETLTVTAPGATDWTLQRAPCFPCPDDWVAVASEPTVVEDESQWSVEGADAGGYFRLDYTP